MVALEVPPHGHGAMPAGTHADQGSVIGDGDQVGQPQLALGDHSPGPRSGHRDLRAEAVRGGGELDGHGPAAGGHRDCDQALGGPGDDAALAGPADVDQPGPAAGTSVVVVPDEIAAGDDPQGLVLAPSRRRNRPVAVPDGVAHQVHHRRVGSAWQGRRVEVGRLGDGREPGKQRENGDGRHGRGCSHGSPWALSGAAHVFSSGVFPSPSACVRGPTRGRAQGPFSAACRARRAATPAPIPRRCGSEAVVLGTCFVTCGGSRSD